MKKTLTSSFVAALVGIAGACGGSPTAAVIAVPDAASYAPALDPANFVADVTNPFFPLPAGATWTYEERDGDSVALVDTVVLGERRQIAGISATVVKDVVSEDGADVEVTFDWYAQDRAGNVWYLGEDTKELKGGKVVSTKGSWEAGVKGAKPGIVMQASPAVGQKYRQEYLRGQAEDLAEVIMLDGALTGPLGRLDGLVVTREWNPLEPKKVEEKYYARGLGPVAERGVKGTAVRVDLTASSLRPAR